ncbi:MAG: hypothetical protein WAM88_05080 [Nitrososphaeraceae archaeon]
MKTEINFRIEKFWILSDQYKIHTIKGVKKVEVFQPIKIKWIQDWLNEELDTKLHSSIIEITLYRGYSPTVELG